MNSIEVCVSPLLIEEFELKGKTTIIIDVFRASSTICSALHSGVQEVIPVSNIAYCYGYRKEPYLLCAERGGKIAKGFSHGNSPMQFIEQDYLNKVVILTTTNGTKCISLARDSEEILIGALSNITVICNYLLSNKKNVVLFCAGWKNRLSYEDTYFAGAVVERLQHKFELLNDASLIAQSFYKEKSGGITDFIKEASHYKRLRKNAIQKDIEYCLQEDTTDVLPVVFEGSIKNFL